VETFSLAGPLRHPETCPLPSGYFFVLSRRKEYHKTANAELRMPYDRLTERVDSLADLMKTDREKNHTERECRPTHRKEPTARKRSVPG